MTDYTDEQKAPLQTRPTTKFLYLTRSFVLRGAELHPTKGWKTHRIKDIASELKRCVFDYNDLILDLQEKHGQVIYGEDKNPMVGFA